ncbi:MAG: outer membrane protein assembly factor BamC [Spongiibacteraceae bacterium]
MKKTLGNSALLALSVSIAGCGWLTGEGGLFRDRGDDYRNAALEKPLQVPSEFSSTAIEDQLVIPRARAGDATLAGAFEVPRPEPINPGAEAEQVKLQKLGEQGWILVDAAPGEVWPRVRQFLATNQLTVLRADATGGIIETGWLQPATGTGRERYRFRIEQGVQRGSSEVYIVQADANAGENTWPTTSSNAQREADMMKALAQFVADNGSTGAVSMLAQQGINAQGKVFLERQAGQPLRLRLALSFERAWASLETGLPKAGFAIDDRNRSERQVWIRYDPAEVDDGEDKGFFASIWDWIFSGDDNDGDVFEDRKTVYTVTVQDGGNNDQLITIDRQDGAELAAGSREKLLNAIKSHLI